jgi:ABC-type sugar transport system substrate-binding protein
MKRRLVLFLILLMTLLAACSSAPKSKPIIAVCLGDLDDPFMLQMKDAFIAEFGEKYDIQVASAENNSITQATQIDNFTAMGVKLIFVIPVDPSSLTSNLMAARKVGILVLVAGGDPGENSRDAILKMDQYLTGEYVTIMAKEWIKEAHPDAEASSIQTVILSSSQNKESTSRSKGLSLIGEPYLVNEKWQYIDNQGYAITDQLGNYLSGKSGADRIVNPYYSAEVRIETTVEAITHEDGQQAMRNILINYPDVELVLAYSSDAGQGASAAIMEVYGKKTDNIITSTEGIAVFGVGLFGLVEEAIIDASVGKGVFRGAVAYGGSEFPETIVAKAKLMLEDKAFPLVTWEELALITAVDGKLSIEPVANRGIIPSR